MVHTVYFKREWGETVYQLSATRGSNPRALAKSSKNIFLSSTGTIVQHMLFSQEKQAQEKREKRKEERGKRKEEKEMGKEEREK